MIAATFLNYAFHRWLHKRYGCEVKL